MSESFESGSLFLPECARLAIHHANRAQLVTRGRRERSAGVEPDAGIAVHKELVSEACVAERVVHDDHVVLLNGLGAQRLRARDLSHRHPDGRLEPLALRIHQTDRRQRRAADLRRQRRQLFELTLAGRIEDGIPPQGLDAFRFHIADHEVMLTRNLATSGTSAVRRRRSTCKPVSLLLRRAVRSVLRSPVLSHKGVDRFSAIGDLHQRDRDWLVLRLRPPDARRTTRRAEVHRTARVEARRATVRPLDTRSDADRCKPSLRRPARGVHAVQGPRFTCRSNA